MYIGLYDQPTLIIVLWVIIAIFTIFTIIFSLVYHDHIHDKHEILRLRPKKFYHAVSPIICVTLLIMVVRRIVYILSGEIFYLMIFSSLSAIFFIVFIDTSYYLILIRKKADHDAKKTFLVKYQSKIRKFSALIAFALIFLNVVEKIVFFYIEFHYYIFVYTLQFFLFLAVFTFQIISVIKQRTDQVGLREQVLYFSVLIIFLPILHIVEVLIHQYKENVFAYLQIIFFYQQIAVIHLIAMVQSGYPILFLLNDMAIASRRKKEFEKTQLENLFQDTLFCQYFRKHLEQNYCELHLDYILESTKIVSKIENLKSSKSEDHDSLLNITDNVEQLIKTYVGETDEAFDQMDLDLMFEGGLDTINIEKELKSELRVLCDKLTNIDLMAFLNPAKQVEIANDMKKHIMKTNHSVIKMLRVNYHKFQVSNSYKEYVLARGEKGY